LPSGRGDVYRCVLLAMRADPASLSFRYEDILRRVSEVCTDENPTGSSVAESLDQMAKLARAVQKAPVIEWDEDVLEQRDERAAFHSINSSATASSVSGTVRPSALAALRLMTSRYVVGC
jgi:hypothetical protein